MYPKHITERIVELWALGFTAEETRKAISEQYKTIGLATIYRHRHNLTAQNLIDELLRHQERAILKANTDMPEVAMKYRNELLKILLPTRIEASTTHTERLITVQLSAKVLSNQTCLSNQKSPSNTNRMTSKLNSTKDATPIVIEQHSQELEAEKPSQA